ncbi:MAG: hypothetical protein PHW22_03900 [Bacilli bacterium]|nr:hypothetical protein [Bacilli bacterium]
MNDDKEKYNLKEQIFCEIENQINKMDSKVGMLISALGIVFALTTDLFSIYSIEKFNDFSVSFKAFCFVITGLYCLSFVFSMFMFIGAILPRTNKKQKKQNNEDFHVNYYYDLSNKLRLASKNKNIDISELFNKAIESEINDGHKNLENQIFTNADICRKKHDKIVMGIVGLIPFVISMIGLIVLMILGYNL